jgi:PAS domain S-box-containing protein
MNDVSSKQQKHELILENEQLLLGIKTRQRDLTKMSRYLSELESQLAMIFAASPDIIVFLDEKTNIIKISDAAFTILGYKRQEMIGKSLWEFISQEDVNVAKERFANMRKEGFSSFNGNKSFINYWITKDAKFVKLAWRFSLCDDRENSTIGVASDITHFNNNVYNFKLLQNAIELSTDGIIIIDSSDVSDIVYINNAFKVITGYEDRDVIGNDWNVLFTEEAKKSKAFITLQTCLNEGRNCDVLLQCKTKDGNIFYNRLALSAVKEGENIVNFIAVMRDITEKIGIKYEWSLTAESGFIHLSKFI